MMSKKSKITNSEVLTNWANENINAESSEIELWWRWMRHMCRTNIWFLAYEVLGYRDLDEEFHAEMCRNLNHWPMMDDFRPYPYEANFWPRGGFKTTLATEARSIQTLLRCPEETILIEHGKKEMAEAILRGIRGQFEKNQLLKWLFPDIIPSRPKTQVDKWTNAEISVLRKGVYKEASVTASSAEADSTGGHYTLLIFDDLVCEENINTKDRMDAVYNHFCMCQSLQDQRWIKEGDVRWQKWYTGDYRYDKETGEMFVFNRVAIIATRWDYRDSNARVIDEENKKFAGRVNVTLIPAVDKDGNSFFPKKYPIKRLMEIKEEMGPYSFSAQYMQDPYPSDAQIFKRGYIKNWTDRTLPKNLNYYTCVDPCVKAATNADNAAVLTIGVSSLGNYYVMQVDTGHYTPREQIRKIIEHYQIWDPKIVGIESVAAQEFLIEWLKEECKGLGIRIPIKPIKRGGRGASSKEHRILKLEPIASSGRIYVKSGDQTHISLVDEMMQWPRGSDDQLDALIDCITISSKPDSSIKRAKDVESTKDLLRTDKPIYPIADEILKGIDVIKSGPAGGGQWAPRRREILW